MRRIFSFLSAVVLFCMAAFLPAQSDEAPPEAPDAERFTIIGEYLESDPRSVSAQISIITEDEIEAAAPANAAEIVAAIPGVQINRYGGAVEPSAVSIRGSSAEQVLVLVNGKRLNTAQGGGVDLGSINPDSIERIEVIRGGSSARFGEGAFGGVINIITKEGYGKEFEHSAEYGFSSYFTHELTLQSLGPIGKEKNADYFFSLRGFSTRGGYTYTDPHAGGETLERSNTAGLMGDASLKLGWTLDEEAGVRLSLSGQFHASDKGVPGLSEFPTPEASMEDIRATGLVSFVFRNNPVAGITVDVTGTKQVRHFTDPGYYLGELDDTHDNTAFGIGLELSRKDDFRFLFLQTAAGYSFRYDHLVSTGLIKAGGEAEEGKADRSAHSGFFRQEYHLIPFTGTGIGRLQLMPSIRFDGSVQRYNAGGYSGFQGRPGFALGVLLPFDRERRFLLKGNIATTYRSPSFDDLFWPSTAFARGNPGLLPEEAVVIDAGMLLKPFDFLSVEGVFFGHDVTNLIQWTPGPAGQWQPGNIGRAIVRGAEAEVKFLFRLTGFKSLLLITGSYTYLYAADAVEGSTTFGKQLPRRAPHSAGGNITLTHDRGHSLYIGGRYVGRRYQTAQNTKWLAPYFVLDATVRIQPFEFLTISLIAKNLLGLEYIDIREFPIPGRELGCSVKITL